MIRKATALLLACPLLIAALSACEPKKDAEMTAVTLETAELTEATETTEATAATEEKRYTPAQTTAQPETVPTEAPTESEPLTEETQAASEASIGTETQTEPPVDLRALAVSCIGCSVDTLYSLIGYPPNGSTYSDDSIFGSGEDGTLYYNGFAVYTHRDNGTETVMDVD